MFYKDNSAQPDSLVKQTERTPPPRGQPELSAEARAEYQPARQRHPEGTKVNLRGQHESL